MREKFPVRPKPTARGIVVHGDQVLMMERWRDELHYYSFVGGRLDWLKDKKRYEEPEETVIREIPEESTVRVELERKVIELHIGGVMHTFFLCRYESGEPHLPDDAPEAQLKDPNNVFKPGWLAIESFDAVSLGYWEPIRSAVMDGLENGFPPDPVVITA